MNYYLCLTRANYINSFKLKINSVAQNFLNAAQMLAIECFNVPRVQRDFEALSTLKFQGVKGTLFTF